MASPGNHEADCTEIDYTTFLCPAGQKNFTDFMNRFGQTMPTAFSSTSSNNTAAINANKAKMLANPPFWYSFEYGMVHFVMFDTETDFASAPDAPGGSAGLNSGPFGATNQQIEFLEADLASVDRTVTPWVVVGGHRPWYSTGGGSSCGPCQTAFEPLLYKYGVDLAIFGHVHNSQRFMPVNNSIADPNGMNNPKAPMYIVAGGAGNIEGLDSVGSNVSYNAFAYATDFAYVMVFLSKIFLSEIFHEGILLSKFIVGSWSSRNILLAYKFVSFEAMLTLRLSGTRRWIFRMRIICKCSLSGLRRARFWIARRCTKLTLSSSCCSNANKLW